MKREIIQGIEKAFPKEILPEPLGRDTVSRLEQRSERDLLRIQALTGEAVSLLGPRLNRNQTSFVVDCISRLVDSGGRGLLVCTQEGLHDIIAPSQLPGLGIFNRIPNGSSLSDLGVASLMPEGRRPYFIGLPAIGREYTATRAAIIVVLRNLLTYRGTNISLLTDCSDPKVAEGYRHAMQKYLLNGEDLLLNLPNIPVSKTALETASGNLRRWPEFSRNVLFNGGNTLQKSRVHSDCLIMNLSKFPTGSFKDPGSLLEGAAMLDCFWALNGCWKEGKPEMDVSSGRQIRSVEITTGNMGMSGTVVNHHIVHNPGGNLVIAVAGRPAITSVIYGSKPADSLLDIMDRYGAEVVTHFANFNEAFGEQGQGVLIDPQGAFNYWVGDTLLRIKASETFALRALLDVVRTQGEGAVREVAQYLESGGQESGGRKILDETAKKMTLIVPVGNAIMSTGIAFGFHTLKNMGIISERPYILAVRPERGITLKDTYDYVAGERESLPEIPKGDVTAAAGIRCPIAVQGPDTYRFADEVVTISDNQARQAYQEALKEDPLISFPGAFSYAFIEHARKRNPNSIIIPMFTGKRRIGDILEEQMTR